MIIYHFLQLYLVTDIALLVVLSQTSVFFCLSLLSEVGNVHCLDIAKGDKYFANDLQLTAAKRTDAVDFDPFGDCGNASVSSATKILRAT